MIGFKNRSDIAPSVMIIVAILTLLVSLYFMAFAPKPTTAGLVQKHDRSKKQIEDDIDQAKQRTVQARTAAQPRLWDGDPQKITATVLARLNQEATRRKLQIGAFRPQKPQPLTGLTELPFSVQVTGPYPVVRAFAAMLDAGDSKIALRSFQIASTDSASSAVTATLGLSAYLESKAEPTAKPSPGGPRG